MSEFTEAEPEIEEKTATGRILTPAEWAEIVELWELGETNLADLSDRFGITKKGLSKGLTKRGVTKGSRAHEIAARVRSTVLKSHEAETMSSSEERRRRIEETKRQHYDWSKAIGQSIMTRLSKAQKEEREFATEKGNIQVLRQAMAALEIARRSRYAVLDVDKDLNENEIPYLELRDLTEEEIASIRSFDTDDGELLSLPRREADVILEDDGAGR